jgi:hypothetical protein
MKDPILTRIGPGARLAGMRWMLTAAALPVLGGCVQVSAPDKPIEINLNINIRQEVVVRLQQDVKDLIQENPGVF